MREKEHVGLVANAPPGRLLLFAMFHARGVDVRKDVDVHHYPKGREVLHRLPLVRNLAHAAARAVSGQSATGEVSLKLGFDCQVRLQAAVLRWGDVGLNNLVFAVGALAAGELLSLSIIRLQVLRGRERFVV